VDRADKEAFITQMKETVNGANVIVVAHYTGLNVVEMNDLRNRMREAGAHLRVTKNRLTKLALEGTPYAGIADMFTGPTVIAYSDDVVAPARVVVEFAKTNQKLVVIGGAMGEDRLDDAGVKALAALPSLDEIRAKLAALVNTPATRIAGVLAAPAGQLARVFSAYGDKD
jgi:large subunit ribosomal protein L10